jgi:tetratricopeptide (TPR) repeat protein
MSDIEIPIELKKAISDNKLIIFVGAGLSYNLVNINGQSLKGWGNLVEEILLHQKDQGHDVDMLLPLVNRYDPIKVLDLIEADPNISKKDIYNFTKDYLDLEDSKNDYSLHKKLFKLSKKIITTNYDTAFERAIPQLRKRKAYKGKNYELTTHRDSDAALLFKLHGCFEDVDSMVLFPSNYSQLYNPTDSGLDAEHSLLVLKNIIYNNSILFIGTGMGDFQINHLFKQINKLQDGFQTKHYIITNKPLDSSLQFLTPITIKEHTEIPLIIDDLIHIKKETLSQESEEVLELKGQLLEYENRVKELESKVSDPTKDELLEGEALKYFTKGLKHQLSGKLKKAIKQYENVSRLASNNHQAYNNCGSALGNLAKTKQGHEAEILFTHAFEKYQKAIKIKPDKYEAFNNWGNNITHLAKTKQGHEAEMLFQQAFEKYQKAIEIKSDNQDVLYNWGNALGNLAKIKQGQEAETLFQQAIKKYQEVIKIKPDDHEAFYSWATSLGSLAKTKHRQEAETFFQQAFEKYQKATEIKPDYQVAYDNWGIHLIYLAKIKKGQEAKILYRQAFEKLQKGVELGGSPYNLACLYSLQNKKKEALLYLDRSIQNKEITIDFILEDSDWKTYLDDPDFLAVIEKYK